jgi:hypothetical protein
MKLTSEKFIIQHTLQNGSVIQQRLVVVLIFRWFHKLWGPSSAIAGPTHILYQLSVGAIGLLRIAYGSRGLDGKLGSFAGRG